jgi:ligand-binding SRPBCC domain-containing protein
LKILLETIIEAPIERVFDLARCIELHLNSTSGTNEQAIAGHVSGLIEHNETVTWRAKHFGINQELTVRVTSFERPKMFEDEMIKGTFRYMKHSHTFFTLESNCTMMVDEFEFKSPLGFIGNFVDRLVLKNYMTRFLMNKNEELKKVAEGDEWKNFLLSIDS